MSAAHGQARTALVGACHAGLDLPRFVRRASSALRHTVAFDRSCWHSIDPATYMLTGAVKEKFQADPRFARYEYAIPDVNKFSYLARRRRPAGVLSIATGGMLEQSARHRDLLSPLGIGDELRASFLAEGQCWGAVALYRDARDGPFTDEDADRVAGLSAVLAEGVRRALLVHPPIPERVAHGPGVVLLDGEDRIHSVSPAARRMLTEALDIGEGSSDRLPAAVFAVAAHARATANEESSTVARVSVPTSTGRWLVLHGTRLAADPALTAVIVDTARGAELAPIIVSSYRLSEREREVTELVLRGYSTAEVAHRLYLSPLTVQDHLKAIFAKTGVRTRRELVSRVFVDHYEPHVKAGTTPTSSGYFTDDLSASPAATENHSHPLRP